MNRKEVVEAYLLARGTTYAVGWTFWALVLVLVAMVLGGKGWVSLVIVGAGAWISLALFVAAGFSAAMLRERIEGRR